jgi:hypothetical protein
MKVVTPTSVELKRDENHTFVFHKDGYQDTSATVTSGTSGWVWGNLLAGGIIGGVVDFATGAAYKFSDDTLYCESDTGSSCCCTATCPSIGSSTSLHTRFASGCCTAAQAGFN